MTPCHIYDLADELMSEILSFLLEPGPRALSSRSHGNGHTPGSSDHEYNEVSDLDHFRLVCKRFMRIGTPYKFNRFTLRFSDHGFRRLDELVDMQLAYYVKTITYMVRPFYQGSEWVQTLQALGSENPEISQLHSRRLREQTNLTETNKDLARLRRAIAAFSALQEIKLLRLQDEADEYLIDFIRDRSLGTGTGTATDIRFDWETACSRAVTNLSIALLDSKCSSIRFTGPQISPEATLQLLRAPSTILAAMAGRLTSLDITFHSTTDITATMADLSGVFHRFFVAAKNLIAIHIGFLSKAPLDLDLELLFHHIRWKTLRKLSIQGWRLSADEIIALARRHRSQLRDFRLLGIYLRPGGLWRDVLAVLREEMERLERLVLKDIDYAAHFDSVPVSNGVEVHDYHVGPMPSSLGFAAGTWSDPQSPITTPLPRDGLSALVRERALPLRTSIERLRSLSSGDLGDDGVHVLCEQLPLWEAWVLSAPHEVSGNGRTHWGR
ncbi:hypothetical protein DTO006G1_3243 [Penicillium roqueforti]|nr:uncharacterized protein LCP9604111_6289 [Penicillium roqueforti]KAF9247590.1 hypothetical protein LCP9604111_6289 [Penicillium roqueforti]KAI1834929.1 hypothetical protein CBS147337_4483 [Penicillium roqueforti]KAI2712359.1 hypothetical protein CBS147318_7792 [Penicillium roqueforti]KAI2725364.1 hypothetical protein CBS147354_4941 [Penicillium roqueforti]KAI2761704.1 hypothetical protein DTO006G1_3243 [Penicillium roqueforti]